MRTRKRKLTKLSIEEWEQLSDAERQKLHDTPEDYDAHWIEVYNGDKKIWGEGTCVGVPGEITFKELITNTDEVLQFMLKHEEVEVLDDHGNTMFFAQKLY